MALVSPGHNLEVVAHALDLRHGCPQVAGVRVALHHELVVAAALAGPGLDVTEIDTVVLGTQKNVQSETQLLSSKNFS